MGAGIPSTSTTVFYAFVTLQGVGDVDNLRILLTAMGNYHEWMSSTYLEMPSITTFASFYIGHMIGGEWISRGRYNYIFVNTIYYCSFAVGRGQVEREGGELGGSIMHVKQSRSMKEKKLQIPCRAQTVTELCLSPPTSGLNSPSMMISM